VFNKIKTGRRLYWDCDSVPVLKKLFCLLVKELFCTLFHDVFSIPEISVSISFEKLEVESTVLSHINGQNEYRRL
jgi:hypothetical protein